MIKRQPYKILQKGPCTRFWPMINKILVAPTPTERRDLDCDYLKKLEESMPKY
jgi:hypothetical protein